MGKHMNGKHVILVLDNKRGPAHYAKASKAIERAVTKSKGFKRMKQKQMISVINAALKDCFEPLPSATVRAKGDHLSQTLGRMGTNERQIQIKDA